MWKTFSTLYAKSYYNKSTQRAQTSLAEAGHYPHIVWIPDLNSQHGDPDHPQSLLNCFIYHCSAILKISSKSAHNLLSNGPICDWTVRMVIRITTKIESLVCFTTTDSSTKFHCNLFITFWVMAEFPDPDPDRHKMLLQSSYQIYPGLHNYPRY